MCCCRTSGGRSKRVSLGPVGVKSLEDIRRQCHARRAESEPEEKDRAGVSGPPVPGLCRGARGRKPTSTATNLRRGGVSGISWRDSSCRPSESKSAGPYRGGRRSGAGSTDTAGPRRAMPTMSLARLRQMLNFAVACGHIESNPAAGHRVQPAPEAHPVPVPGGESPASIGSWTGKPGRTADRRPTSSAFCC